MTIPKTVKIGWRDYSVTEGEHKSTGTGDDVWGRILYEESEIYLYKEQPAENKRVTLLHEVMHAIFFMTGHDDYQKNEELVTLLSENLYQVIKDNPELFAVEAKTQSAPVEVTHVGV